MYVYKNILSRLLLFNVPEETNKDMLHMNEWLY